MKTRPTTRRYFLAEGTRLFAVGSLTALLACLGLPTSIHAQDWRALLRGRPRGGEGKVKELKGSATAAGQPLAVGKRLKSGEEIRVAAKSRLIIALSDNTIFRVNANTVVTLEMSRRRTGFFRLLVGSLLTVMPRGNQYLVHMPTTTIGIKGTVFFHQIYRPGEKEATDAKAKVVKLPEGINEYFCLCNGLADFLQGDEATAFFSDVSAYHNSYYIDPTRPNPLVRAPQLNHTDQQILELINLQDGPRHDTAWLRNYYRGTDAEASEL